MSAGTGPAEPPEPGPDSALTTTRVLHLLRAHRRAALRRNRGDAAYLAYLAVFVGGLTVPPAVFAVVDAVTAPAPLDPWPPHRFAALAPLFLAGLLGLLWASAREATVRGPVQVGAALIDWVLPLPVDRSRFLTPSLLRSAATRGAAGAVLCPLVLVLLWRTVLPMPGEGTAAGAVVGVASAGDGAAWVLLAQAALAGALAGVLSSACGALVVAFGPRTLRRVRPWHALAQVLLLGAALLVWVLPAPFSSPLLAQSLRVGGWAGPALMAAGAVWLLLRAWRSLRLVEPAALRERAATAFGLRSGIWMSDPSWFQVAVTERMDRADQDAAPVRPTPEPEAAGAAGAAGAPGTPGASEPGGQVARSNRRERRFGGKRTEPGGLEAVSAGSGHQPGGQAARFRTESTHTHGFRSWLRTRLPTGWLSRSGPAVPPSGTSGTSSAPVGSPHGSAGSSPGSVGSPPRPRPSPRPYSGPRFRLRPPRDARYLVLWRDLLGMLRAPYPVLRGCVLGWAALVALRTDAHLEGAAAVGWVLAPTVLLYLAAAQLLSGARMDVADPRRVRYLPPTQSFGTLALLHGVLPLLCLFAAVGAALPLLLLSGAPPADAGALLLILPAVVAGSLVGVYRGWMPDHLTVGVETPMGNTAPLQMAAWHLSGLLGLLLATAPVVVGTGLGRGPGVLLGLWWLDVLWVLLGTAWLVGWARKRARASLSA